MKMQRLKQRIRSAQKIGIAYLDHFRMAVNKVGSDQSTKANILPAPTDSVIGILYEIDEIELMKLDRIEDGYERREVEVRTQGGTRQNAWTYLSQNVTCSGSPYCWYMKYLIDGAAENKLPQEYIAHLRSIKCLAGEEA